MLEGPLLAVSFGTWFLPKRLLTSENPVYCDLNHKVGLSSRQFRFEKPLLSALFGRSAYETQVIFRKS